MSVLQWSLRGLLVVGLATPVLLGCGGGGALDVSQPETGDPAEVSEQTAPDTSLADQALPDGSVPDHAEVVLPIEGNGCPSTTGFRVSGVVRLASLHPTPTVSGPTVVVKFPCGREQGDPSKATCGTGPVLVWLCTTPDCSAPVDPIRRQENPEGKLVQTSFDKEPFEFCGLAAGTYHVLPILDHDSDGALSNYDWTMGVKNLADTSVAYPARAEGYEVAVTADVALGTSLTPTNPEASPVVVNFFYYRHPSPTLKPESSWLFLASSLNPAVAVDSVGLRAVDLDGWKETDFLPTSQAVDAKSLADAAGTRYEGDLEKLLFHEGVAYLGANPQGLVLTAKLGADGSVTQGNFIDLGGLGVDHKLDVAHSAALLEAHGRRFLAVTNRESAGKPLPHQPAFPLWIVDVTDLPSGNVTDARLLNATQVPDLHNVRLDQVMAHGGMLFAVESGANSRARSTDNLTRLWVLQVDATGAIAAHHIYDVSLFKTGTYEECSTNPPYRQAGLWVGEFNGATHAFIGGLRTVAVFRFVDGQVDSGARVQLGEGLDKYDLPLDEYALGFSILRVSPDRTKLFAFGDCKGRYLAVRPGDWAGDDGVRTQSRRRTAVLDLAAPGAEGLPGFYAGYADRVNVPDLVREGLNGADQTLSETEVMGIGTDCRGVLWDLYDTYGYQNIAGSTFGSDCLANRVADAVVTEHHVYVIGEGAVANKTTGLGVSSEVLALDLATGQEVLHPDWMWMYDGSSYQQRYGYFGQTLGERDDVETSKGLFLVPRP